MNRQRNKLTQQQREEQQSVSTQQGQECAAIEFKSPEEALRHDREQTSVPAKVAERLNRSAKDLPKRQKRWWQFWGE